MKKLSWLFVPVMLVGCSGQDYGQYTQAVKEQNVTTQIRIEAANREREERDRKHEEKMMAFAVNAMQAAGVTKDKTDDLMVPMVLMLLEDKWSVAKMVEASNQKEPQLQTVKAPETTGELISKAAPAVLSLGGMALSGFTTWTNNQTTSDLLNAATLGTSIVMSGEGNTTNTDSFKSGSDNTVVSSGDSTITAGDVVNGDQCPTCTDDDGGDDTDDTVIPTACKDISGSYYKDGVWWVGDGCSCSTWLSGGCDSFDGTKPPETVE